MKLHKIVISSGDITYSDIYGKYYLIYGNNPKYVSIVRGTDKSNASVFDEITKVTLYNVRDRIELLLTPDTGQIFCDNDIIYELTDKEVFDHVLMETI